MSQRLSASGLGRALHCPAAYALPAVFGESEHASRGRSVHRFIEAVQRGTDVESVLADSAPEVRALCSKIDLRRIPRGLPELSMAYDVATGRARVMDATGRYYEVSETEIPGTCDLYVAPTDTTPARVIDWKTIVHDQPDEHLYRPQLEFYALCLARVHRLSSVGCEVYTIGEDGAVSVAAQWTLDVWALADVATVLRRVWGRVQAERLKPLHDVTTGAHCRHCNAWLSCPAQLASVGAVLGVELSSMTREQAAEAYLRARAAEKHVERIKTLTREMVAANGPLEASGQRIYMTSNKSLRVVRSA